MPSRKSKLHRQWAIGYLFYRWNGRSHPFRTERYNFQNRVRTQTLPNSILPQNSRQSRRSHNSLLTQPLLPPTLLISFHAPHAPEGISKAMSPTARGLRPIYGAGMLQSLYRSNQVIKTYHDHPREKYHKAWYSHCSELQVAFLFTLRSTNRESKHNRRKKETKERFSSPPLTSPKEPNKTIT